MRKNRRNKRRRPIVRRNRTVVRVHGTSPGTVILLVILTILAIPAIAYIGFGALVLLAGLVISG